MGLKRGGFGMRTARLVARVPLKSDPSKPLKRSKGLTPGAPPARTEPAGDRAKTPQQRKRATKQAAWTKVRDLVLERDDWTCVRCGRSDLRLEVHHRRHRSQGGEDVPSNLVSLCGFGNHANGNELCHGWAHDRANSDAVAVGLSVPWGTEPHELEVLYPDGRRYLLNDDAERVPA